MRMDTVDRISSTATILQSKGYVLDYIFWLAMFVVDERLGLCISICGDTAMTTWDLFRCGNGATQQNQGRRRACRSHSENK
jgi:hypothetical protein